MLANYDYGRNRLSDALGELGRGGPRRTDDQTHTAFGRVAASVKAMPWLEITTIGTARYQAYDPKNELSTAPEPASDRLTAAGTLETRFFGDVGKVGLELRSSVRLAWTRVAIREVPLVGEPPGESSAFLPTYRVAAAISPLEWLAFRGSVSSGFKLPSLLQLFGNRTNVEGNPDLVQERSVAYDGAVTLRGHREALSGYASVGAFLTHLDDAIRFRRTSASTFKAENIGGARNRGVEVELRGGVRNGSRTFSPRRTRGRCRSGCPTSSDSSRLPMWARRTRTLQTSSRFPRAQCSPLAWARSFSRGGSAWVFEPTTYSTFAAKISWAIHSRGADTLGGSAIVTLGRLTFLGAKLPSRSLRGLKAASSKPLEIGRRRENQSAEQGSR